MGSGTPRGRPKGSTGVNKWTPKKIAKLWQDAETLVERGVRVINRKQLAKLLKDKFPRKYGSVSEDHLRQQLGRNYQQRKRTFTLGELDAFNAALLAHLLRETK